MGVRYVSASTEAKSYMSQPSNVPVEEGEQYHVEIEELGEEGDGIGYVSGFVVFVPETEIGDTVEIEIEQVHESFAIASVLEQYD